MLTVIRKAVSYSDHHPTIAYHITLFRTAFVHLSLSSTVFRKAVFVTNKNIALLNVTLFCVQNMGSEHYVNILSFVDKEQLEPGCAVLLNHKTHRYIRILDKLLLAFTRV